MAKTDRARKLLVRTALVTSTTIATLIGAQNFAMLDARAFQPNDETTLPAPQNIVIVPPAEIRTPVPVERAAPNITIMNAAPSITILRQSGQVSPPQPAPISVTSIQPPAPAQIAAPDPVVVQQPAPQRSRSSR